MVLRRLPLDLTAYEAAVDDAIAGCDGDLRGALSALITANEFLEPDLETAASALIGSDSVGLIEHKPPTRRLRGGSIVPQN
jgi:hypothetical protein